MSYGYDYRPLSPSPVRKRHFWGFVLSGLCLLFIVNVCVLKSLYRTPRSLLDDYHPLINIPEGLDSHYATTINASIFETPSPEERAVVTTLFTESYVPAVLTLGYSLSTVQVTARRILLYFPERLSSQAVCQLQAVGWELYPIERIAPPDGGRGVYYRFVDNFSKLQIWTLDKIGIKSVVYLDADTLVRRNFDELWSLPFAFAAVPDVYGDNRGFTLAFNAGVMFLRTSSAAFADMLDKIESKGYNHGEAEQGLLRMYFAAETVLLPYLYNANLMIKQRNPDLWQAIEKDTRIVHYTMLKPFIEEDRQQALGGIWAPEMEWWEAVWRDAFITDVLDKC